MKKVVGESLCSIEEEVCIYTGGQEAIGSTLNTVTFNQYSAELQSTFILPYLSVYSFFDCHLVHLKQ